MTTTTHLNTLHPSVEIPVTPVVVFHGIQHSAGSKNSHVCDGDLLSAQVRHATDLEEVVQVIQACLQQVLLLRVRGKAVVYLGGLKNERLLLKE